MLSLPHVNHRFVDVLGVRIFYREAGPADGKTLLLLHGFPSASHQFRRLIDALGTRYRVIAPDYPGFGHSDAPPPSAFTYSFDHLADTVEAFCEALGLRRFTLYAFDFGGPVGFRVAVRHPDWIAGLIVQNANAYDEGMSPLATSLAALRGDTPGARGQLLAVLTLDATRGQYLGGAALPERVAPDGWTLDQALLDLPGRKDIQIAL